jgi:hypothetical protein
MKSQFTRKQIDDNLMASERHLQDLFHAVGRVDYNGWTDTVDFMVSVFQFSGFFYRLSLELQLV